MPVSKKIDTKKGIKTKYAVALAIIIIGILITIFNVGESEFAGFPSLGTWIIFTGAIIAAITTMKLSSKKERIIDERMEHIGYKASRVTTLMLILTLFSTMILDGIYTLTIPYHIYASFLVCFYIAVYVISYKVIERNN
jgi:L-asparagine transporter-like permease